MTQIKTAAEAMQNPDYLKALTELLYQLADDDFIISFRGAEWLGLAPHIEEDVAYSSITQNTMGHAVMFYDLLEELGEGDANKLAHERLPEERRNAIYLEKRNGEGSYLTEPYFDWALTVVRQYLYEAFKKVKMEALTTSSYLPLANIAQRVLMEQPYHLAHWKTWLKQLQRSTEDAKTRIDERLTEAWNEFLDVLELGPFASEMKKHQLISGEDVLKKEWLTKVEATLVSVPEGPLEKMHGSGRSGAYTEDLVQALQILSEVYHSEKNAVW